MSPLGMGSSSNPTPVISAVGSYYHGDSASLATLSVAPVNLGDLLVLAARPVSVSSIVSTVSGGGVTTWTKLIQYQDASYGADIELWMGPVTVTGTATITLTYTGGTGTVELTAQEFSVNFGRPPVWTFDKASATTTALSTTVPFPSLTPARNVELYVGYGFIGTTGVAGSTPGVVYDVLPSSSNIFLYATAVTTTLAPVCTQTAATNKCMVAGALIQAL
jgi:hypothetical protein